MTGKRLKCGSIGSRGETGVRQPSGISGQLQKVQQMPPKYKFEPNWIVTPGELITDHMDGCGIPIGLQCERSGLTFDTITALMRDEQRIEQEHAEGLERALGFTVQFWINVQNHHDEELKRFAQAGMKPRRL